MTTNRLLLALSLLFPTSLALASSQANWPQFRGPNGDGHTTAANLPLTWSETENVKWKTPIHDRAWSSPVIADNQIWMTTATQDGHQLFALCLDLQTGRILRDLKLFDVEQPQFAHEFNTYASPTPVIENDRVYVTFGSPGTACLDARTGNVLWERRDLVCNHFRGAGSSPILHQNLLIMNFDGSDLQYVIALNKHTGETVWKTDRSIDFKDLDSDGKPEAEGDFRKCFSTPHIATFNGQPILFSIGAKATYAYHPDTGKEIWRVEERTSHSGSTRPVAGTDLLFFPTGWSKGQLLAVRPDGTGDITDTHVAWRVKRSVPRKPSLLLVNDLIFMIEDGGIASCLQSQSGEVLWQERVGGKYSASPLATPGRIYCFSEEGKTAVLEAGKEFKVLAENQLDDGFMASPAVADNALILRTKSHLYRIQAP